METPEFIVALLAALGVGAVFGKVTDVIIKSLTGRKAREREGWEAADEAEREKRALEEWGHHVRVIAIQRGFYHLLPPMPGAAIPRTFETPGSILE